MVDFQTTAKIRVLNFFNDFRLDGVEELTLDELSVIWFCQTVDNWKAVITTNKPDDIYYEVTYDSNVKETYLDVYSKMYTFIVSENIEKDSNQLSLDILDNNVDL